MGIRPYNPDIDITAYDMERTISERSAEIPCEAQYVTDGIGNQYLSWTRDTVVFIDAPTGSGKNTFVLSVLAEEAKKYDQFVMLLSNRTALSMQQKRKLWEANCRYPITDEDLQKEWRFGNILIFSYQELSSWLSPYSLHNSELRKYISTNRIRYAVFDEAHFFLSDSRFNNSTYQLLRSLINTMCHAVRIYMSATLEEVLDLICVEEYKEYMRGMNCSISVFQGDETMSNRDYRVLRYRFPRRYGRNYNFSFFGKWDCLVNEIKQANSNEKWLIFVRNALEKNEIAEELNKFMKRNEYEFLEAARKGSGVFRGLCVNEKFQKRVLISTIVLDNGININDPALKHIVIHSYDKVSMLQMVGRKRLHREETVNVYIMVPPDIDKEFSKDEAKIKELREFLDDIKKNPYTVQNNWGSISEEKQKLLVQQSLQYGQPAVVFVPNPLAEMKLKIEQGRIEDLKRRCEGDEVGVQKAILEWFKNAQEFSQEMVMSNRPVDCSELTEYIEACIKDGKIIKKDAREKELSRFSERYTAIMKKKLENGNKEDRINQTINNALNELGLPYSFQKTNKSHNEPEWQYVRQSNETELKNV